MVSLMPVVLSAYRQLMRERVFVVTAVLSLALGAGAVGGVLAVADGALFQPPPGVHAPHELATIRMLNGEGGRFDVSPRIVDGLSVAVGGRLAAAGYRTVYLHKDGFATTSLPASFISAGYFSVLGLTPALGRLPTAEELATSGSRVLILSHAAWRIHFSGDSAIVGTRIVVNASPHTVVGVVNEGFRGFNRARSVDVWLPASSYPVVTRNAAANADATDDNLFYEMITRVPARQGRASVARAEAVLRTAFANVAASAPRVRREYVPTALSTFGLDDAARSQIERLVVLLAFLAALVLASSTASAIHVALLRATAARQTMAVRRALGASESHLVRQTVAEFALLGFAAGILGVGIGIATNALIWASEVGALAAIQPAAPSASVFVLIAIGTSMWAMIPAAAVWVIAGRVREGNLASARQPGRRGRDILVSTQVAVSFSLVVAALLLTRTVASLGRVMLGFDPENVVAYQVSPRHFGHTKETLQPAQAKLLQDLRVDRRLEAIALASSMPFTSYVADGVTTLPGDDSVGVQGAAIEVSAGYFDVMRVHVLRGSGFVDAPPVVSRPSSVDVILSEELVRRIFPRDDALGRQVRCCYYGRELRTVSAVVGETRVRSIRDASWPTMYVPWGANLSESTDFFIVVRSTATARSVDSIVDLSLARALPGVPVFKRWPLSTMVEAQRSEERMVLRLSALLTIAVAVLTALGLYAGIGYDVSKRTRELGIRLALGSTPSALIGVVAAQSARLVAIGVAAGVVLSLGGARLIERRLYGVEQLDPAAYAGAAGMILFIAAVATWVPARRAARVDPVTALRND